MTWFYYRDIFPIFLLIFVRLLGITITSPIFSSSIIPPQFIVTLIFLISIILYPFAAPLIVDVLPHDLGGYVMMLVNELFVGFAIGLFLSVIFTAFEMAGELFSYQMGLGISEVLDPLSEVEVPVVGQVYSSFATFIFIAINGLEYEILVLKKSFEMVKHVQFASSVGTLYTGVLDLLRQLFLLALQIAIPIIVTLLIINFVLGVISKFAPQVNVFMVGINIQVMVGFVLLLLYVPFYATMTNNIFHNLFVRVIEWMKLLQ